MAPSSGSVLTVVGTEPPGRTCGPYTAISVGVQRGRVAEDLVPGDTAAPMWGLPLTPRTGPAGPDVAGPHVQGRPGGRFVYLVWHGRQDGGTEAMFRRLKIPLDTSPGSPVGAALLAGSDISVEVCLTGPDGTPACGGRKTDALTWTRGGSDSASPSA